MADRHHLQKAVYKLWIATRFIVFGVGGFVLLIVCWIGLVSRMDDPREQFLHPAIALPLVLAGALMILFGVGEWGRWAYLWVFISTPLVVSVMLLFPDSKWGNSKEAGVLIISLPMILSYLVVRQYYRWLDAKNANGSVESSPLPSPPSEK